MVDLSSISSLPMQFDFNHADFIFHECIRCRNRYKVPLENLLPALLNKSLRYPETVYEENEDLFTNTDEDIFKNNLLHYDVIVLPAGLLGIEYIKTHIYYSPKSEGKYSCVIECLMGILTVLIQKNKPKDEYDFDTSVEEGIMIKLRRGEKVAIPTGYYYTFINTKNSPVIFSRIYKNKGVVDYSILGNEQGLAYFAIRKNARTEIVFNPRYRGIPKIKKYTPTQDGFKLKFCNKPLYEEVKKEINYFMDSLLAF